tara:strand:- start:1121 stop:1561 length:441 start_codon:yes stop_codon:yes gene_type:complete
MTNIIQFKNKPQFTFSANKDAKDKYVSFNGIKLNDSAISFDFDDDNVYIGKHDEIITHIPIDQFNEVVAVFMGYHTMPEPTKKYKAIMDDDDHYIAECCRLGVIGNSPDDFVWKLGDPLFLASRKLGLSPQYVIHKLFGGVMNNDE